MKTENFLFSLATLLMLLLTACNSDAQQSTPPPALAATDAKIEIIQFHSEHRCMTCNKIEELTRATLESYPTIPFSLVNVDEATNEKMAARFGAFGSALFLHDPATGKKKDLTDFAFMTAGNEEKFAKGLKEEIAEFTKP
jgi:hypothetical protein